MRRWKPWVGSSASYQAQSWRALATPAHQEASSQPPCAPVAPAGSAPRFLWSVAPYDQRQSLAPFAAGAIVSAGSLDRVERFETAGAGAAEARPPPERDARMSPKAGKSESERERHARLPEELEFLEIMKLCAYISTTYR